MEPFKSSSDLHEYRKALIERRGAEKPAVSVCGGTGCTALGCRLVRDAAVDEIAKAGLAEKVDVRTTGCRGLCERGPLVVIEPQGILYHNVAPSDARHIVADTVSEGKIIERLCLIDPATGERVPHLADIPFFKHQTAVVFRNAGKTDPGRIDDYIARDGYGSLAKALAEMTPENVIDEIKASGLRGRGGAGFPTGEKWAIARSVASPEKYVICNSDVIEGDPHSAIEGMTLCAYAIGARQGHLYVRSAASSAAAEFATATAQAREAGLLGAGILGTDFAFDITVQDGTGLIVSGEETALIALIEGRRGEPAVRPPFPAESGLRGKPTVVNNLETFMCVPPIVTNGAAWFASMGSEGSSGTKVFALSGRLRNTGFVEVPMGTTLRELIHDVGGGVPGGRKLKAIQIGGAVGGMAPADSIDTPLDFESIAQMGATMGSGSVVVADDSVCMVQLTRDLVSFLASESCGKCIPCRIGTTRMAEMLTKMTEGHGTVDDLAALERVAADIRDTSLCGLGKGSASPVLSSLRYFKDEYLAHIEEGRCPAGGCEALAKAPCNNACPARIDTSSYVALIADGRFDEALAVHRERNPFAMICGRTCHHPCEVRCRRNEVDKPIAIRALKRFMSDACEYVNERPMHAVGKKVAVVGSGPAGLSCAYQLALCGYAVAIFEKLPVAGGMMTVGIPEYRLPKKLVAKEVDAITQLGVKIEYGKTLGTDFTIDGLMSGEFSAVFIAIGAHVGKKARIEGEDAAGVIQGVDYLRSLVVGDEIKLGAKVAVVGGGDVALDAARSALRHGAGQVTVVYRRGRAEMPAHEWDIVEGEEEGVVYEYMTAPTGVVVEDSRAVALRCVRTELGERDESGRRSPVVIEGSSFDIPVDSIILAIGQDVDTSCISPQDGIALEGERWFSADDRFMTNREGVFIGGDSLTGPATLVEAVGAGQKAAFEIDRYLSGACVREAELIMREGRLIEASPEEDVAARRIEEKALAPEERKKSDVEVTLTISESEAVAEARRCLRCDRERAEMRAESEKQKAAK